MESIAEILQKKKLEPIEEPKRVLQEFQILALEMGKKYGVKGKDLGVFMRYCKIYKDSLDYIRYVDGWLSDYPNLHGDVIPLFLWKIREDKLSRRK